MEGKAKHVKGADYWSAFKQIWMVAHLRVPKPALASCAYTAGLQKQAEMCSVLLLLQDPDTSCGGHFRHLQTILHARNNSLDTKELQCW